ncbi:MAG TPA: DUF1998 domain-containing protein [Candidatus Contendobacter sp.]|nr:DUF1998 domain-containing protein [Verrucomicrobiota bacterium]HRZ53616.1 DUF1998 domain-containing protein [Candidatus Contendobacter sp.]
MKPHGQVRRGQLLNTFGPGALIDLPKQAVLVGGLDHWRWITPVRAIAEPRLLQKIRRFLPEVRELREPPVDPDPDQPGGGVTVWQFPEWFITQDILHTHPRYGRSRRLVHRRLVQKNQFEDEDRKKHPVVPVRFVRACPKGHIGDIDWYAFVHEEATACRRNLWIDEQGTSGDIASLWVRCDCGKRRSLASASNPKFKALGYCDGGRPWLGGYHTQEECHELNRLLIRSASHAYFPQLLSVISLPLQQTDPVMEAVTAVWDTVAEAETVEEVEFFSRKVVKVREAIRGYDSGRVLSAIRAHREAGSAGDDVPTIKDAELAVLTADQDPIGRDHPDSEFYARVLPRAMWDHPGMEAVERVLLIHRLREVVAQVGFTRFEAVAPDTDGELDIGVERATLSAETTWLPAIENRGEGIFIGFQREKIRHWLRQSAVNDRHLQLVQGFQCWQQEHPTSQRVFPGADYLLMHTLSHLLLTVIALECGYPASAIRERVYASELGYGILLYTASSDAEGTLGGLVKAGERIHHHLRAALDWARLCGNDPVCAQHKPDDPHERRFLHGAACHGCLLIAETSCEQFNDFLDRSLVAPTVDQAAAAFFPDPP